MASPAAIQNHSQRESDPYSAKFSGLLASVLFDTPADPDRDAAEVKVVQRMEQWLNKASKREIWTMALYFDETIIPVLSGKNFLHMARLIEDRTPPVILQMRNLRLQKEHLERSSDLAEILSAAQLERLINAMNHASSASDTKD